MGENGTGSAAIDALLRLSLAEGNGSDSAAGPGSREMALPMSDAVRRAGDSDPALSYAQTLGEAVPREGFVDEAADFVITFPFPPEVIAAARADIARGTGWRRCFAFVCAAIGVAAVWKEGSREPSNGVGVAIGALFLVVAALLLRRRAASDPSVGA